MFFTPPPPRSPFVSCPNSETKLNLCPRRMQDFHFVTQRSFLEEKFQGQWVRMPKTNQPQTAFWQLYWCEGTH